MKRSVALGVLLAMASFSMAQETTTTIRVQGGEIGKNTERRNSDGTVWSQSKVKLGPQESKFTYEVKKESGKLTRVVVTQEAGPNKAVITLENGKMKVTGTANVEQAMAMPDALYSPFFPYSWQTLIDAAKKSPKVKILYLDNFTPMEFEFKSTPQTVTINGKVTTAQLWTTVLSGLNLEFVEIDGVVVGNRIKQQSFESARDDMKGVFEDPLAKFPELSQPTITKFKTERAEVPMRDGKKLIATVIRPDADGKFPVIFTRTPYGRALSAFEATRYASRGYVYISQDVRGMGESEGDFDPLATEVADGKDSLDWIQAQPWCDGNIGMIGASYGGFAQWAAAVNHHPALKCIVPQVSPPQPTKNIPWENGAFMLMGNIWWSRIVKDRVADMSQTTAVLPNLATLNTMPLNKLDDAFLKRDVGFWNEWIKRDTIAEWPGAFTTEQVASVKIPALNISGFWDGDGIGTMLHWNARTKAKQPGMLIFGPWGHAFNTSSKFADVDYGPGALLELDSVYLRWFDTYLKGKDVGLLKLPRVRFFVSGANEWVQTSAWPMPGAKPVTFYLGGDSQRLEGTLSPSKPTRAVRAQSYAYDPNKIKMANVSTAVSMNADAASLTAAKSTLRGGGLIYRTAPMKARTRFAGSLEADLYVSTTGRDAAFHATVFVERKDGKITLLGLPGVTRITYLTGEFKPVEPNKVYRITLEPWWFAHEFEAGSRLVFGINSNRFPNFARIPGTGENDENATKMVAVTNSVFADKDRPSLIRLWQLP
jgi:uncharacterized protein